MRRIGRLCMEIWELVLVGVSLAMDAFAASLCKGLGMKKLNWRHAAVIALFFGVFQAVMPLIGWFLGSRFEAYISDYDHWIAFTLLVVIGGKMMYDALRPKKEGTEEAGCAAQSERLNYKELLLLAVATSIDALAVGITFAFLKVKIGMAVGVIGMITFVLSLAGVALGSRVGARFSDKAAALGGAVLILIGVKILLEHLGVLAL